MKYDELLEILRECNDCICEEHCPYHEERNNPIRCMTKIVGDAADAIEKLLGVIQRQKEMINVTAYLPLYQKPKWISVEDRLPEKANRRYWSDEVLVWDGVSEFIAEYGGFQNTWTANTRIHYWMPLPEPPKEETDGN